MNQIISFENAHQSPVSDEGLYDETSSTEESTESFVTFRLGSEWYGVSVKDVREIVRTPPIASLPSLPFSIIGIANVRGDLLAVVDPKRIFGLPTSEVSSRSRLIVLTSGGTEAGLLADEVAEMIPVPLSQLEPPLATLNVKLLSYFESICEWQERLIAIFRVSKLLDFKESRKADTQGPAADAFIAAGPVPNRGLSRQILHKVRDVDEKLRTGDTP